MAYLSCGYNETSCGTNPAVVPSNDIEADPRFGKNYIVARDTAVTIQTPIGSFLKDKKCVYVVRKTYKKVGLVFLIQSNIGVSVTYFKGGRNFADLNALTETATTTDLTKRFEWSSFPDSEYLYIILTSRSNDA